MRNYQHFDVMALPRGHVGQIPLRGGSRVGRGSVVCHKARGEMQDEQEHPKLGEKREWLHGLKRNIIYPLSTENPS